ncbi:ABC transporter permease [Cryptosporangium arvum]|uniref:ABC transporter permease n=1 Tax=Cryptosporangium arvum TaxID=80871 RepID=UPI0004AE7460|nr:ABC transporter permease [Cryptosporangium arvum]
MSAVRAELIKLRTVRSTAITFALAVAVSAGSGALLGAAFRGRAVADVDPLFTAFYGLTIAQIPLVVFAVLAVGEEYRSGLIRVSLAAVPRRGRFVAAKIGAVLGFLAPGAAVVVAVAFVAARAAPGGPGAAPAILGAWLYLVLISLFALGFAMLVRSPVVALGVLLPLLFLGSQGLGNVPAISRVTQYLPDQLGWVAMHLAGPQDDPRWARDYGPWTGLALLGLWAAAALISGWVAVRRRDA